MRLARDWSIRCVLEMREHDAACWVTLTYDDRHLPRAGDVPTLDKQHLSGYLKRVRERVRQRIPIVRFFATGEYGDTTQRPHYHSILYGVPPTEVAALERAWPNGFVRVDPLTPGAVAYTAGYAQKKIDAEPFKPREVVDPETGEVLTPQPPFRLMSRGGKNGHGIGGAARRHARSWRRSAIFNGKEVPVPRYLHDSWKEVATDAQLEALKLEKQEFTRWRDYYEREAGELIALAKYGLQTQRRKL